jgi:hypothetical protein
MRAFLSHPQLSARFRFVFVDAPFTCAEGIGVVPVYAAWGPYRRWFRWRKDHSVDVADTGVAHRVIWDAISSAMEKDEGRGEWVGLCGFSQGAKVACSVLYEQQLRVDRGVRPRKELGEVNWQFGIIMAGRCPFAALSAEGEELPWLQSAVGLPDEADLDAIVERPDMKLRAPTLHVHGLRDEGLVLHRRAVEEFCAPGTASVIEWDGPHRVPIKKADVERVVEGIVGLADEYGIEAEAVGPQSNGAIHA